VSSRRTFKVSYLDDSGQSRSIGLALVKVDRLVTLGFARLDDSRKRRAVLRPDLSLSKRDGYWFPEARKQSVSVKIRTSWEAFYRVWLYDQRGNSFARWYKSGDGLAPDQDVNYADVYDIRLNELTAA
jgi:hypothetical protein